MTIAAVGEHRRAVPPLASCHRSTPSQLPQIGELAPPLPWAKQESWPWFIYHLDPDPGLGVGPSPDTCSNQDLLEPVKEPVLQKP